MRAHGFTKQTQDVTKVLRVCGITVTNRLKDFESTPSANLTLDQFTKETENLIEVEADPPVFTRNRIREARAQAILDNNMELLESGKLDDPKVGPKRSAKWRKASTLTKGQQEKKKMYEDIEKTMVDGEEEQKEEEEEDEKEENDDNQEGESSESNAAKENESTAASNSQLQLQEVSTLGTNPCPIPFPKGNNGKELVLPNQATLEELQKSTQKEEDKLNLDEWKVGMPTECMDEIDCLFRSDEEMKQKEAIFNEMNKAYLEKQAQKESDRLAAETLATEQEAQDAVQAEEQAKYLRQRHKRPRGDQTNSVRFEDEPSTQEALIATLESRKISRKINYDAMSAIFDDTGSFSTDQLEDNRRQADSTEVAL